MAAPREGLNRREGLIGAGLALLSAGPAAAVAGTPARKVLRVAFPTAESGFDPPRVSDQSSIRVIDLIFESPLTYDHLARPARLVPQTAAALPEVSADFRHFVFTLRPGTLFADDPAFGGRPRELTAADHVYAIKRFYDPAIRTEHLYQFENAKILGLSELRRQVLRDKAPFPYDTEVPGLRALDRYRFEIRLADPAPRFALLFASPVLAGAVAREVVEAHAADPMAHPVGTGPFRLVQWRRASRIVLERNPRFREQIYASAPPPGDVVAAEVSAHLQGKRLPLLDGIEIQIVEETQPRWLAFLGGEIDLLALPPTFARLAMPGNTLAPFLVRRGVRAQQALTPSVALTYFNFDDPLVGGLAPEKVALRRAIALAWDSPAEIRLLMGGQALPAQSLIPPHCMGYDPALRSELGAASPARANALLDLYGYAHGADGWRRQPAGAPLLLRIAHVPDQRARQASELHRKWLQGVGLRVDFEVAPFAELIKRALAGRLMMWGFSWSAGAPDGDFFLGLGYGPNAGQSNDARFRLPAFDRLYERQRVLPDGPERRAVMHDATRLMLAYMPYLAHYHLVGTDLLQPQLRGYLRHPFTGDGWRYTDLVAG